MTSIGRGDESTVVIEDPSVSRRHATISFQEGTYVLEDEGSSGGTMVEGSTASRTELKSGSAIKIGETELVFMPSESGATAIGAPSGATPGGGRPGETVVMGPAPSVVLMWLAVTGGPDKGKTHQLTEGDTTIGRDQGTGLVLADAAVSRRHALVRYQDGKATLYDIGSTGGTRLNGEVMGGKTLPVGGSITIGETQLVVVDVDAQQAETPAASEGATMVAGPAGSGSGVAIVRSGPDAGKSFSLPAEDALIGREPECHVLLSDPAASRMHALVRRQGDSFVVFDLGSRSGTQVEGETITGKPLSNGDVISVGRSELAVMQPESPKK